MLKFFDSKATPRPGEYYQSLVYLLNIATSSQPQRTDATFQKFCYKVILTVDFYLKLLKPNPYIELDVVLIITETLSLSNLHLDQTNELRFVSTFQKSLFISCLHQCTGGKAYSGNEEVFARIENRMTDVECASAVLFVPCW